jgi:hypothetical protein
MVIIMNYPVEFLGQTVAVRLTVSDGLDSSFQNIAVTITEDFPPELVSPLPDIVFLEDSPLRNVFDLDYYFLDIDGDLLYYTTGNNFVNITINPDNSVDLSAPQDWFGTEMVYFRANDPTGALIEDIVLVTVLPINDAPVILPIPEQYGNESQRWVLDLSPYILDVDNNISELEISVDNDFVVVSGSTLIFIGSREIPNEVLVTVSDGELYADQLVEVHLRLIKPPKSVTLYDLFLNLLPFLIIIILIIAAIAGTVYRKKSHFEAEEVFLIHKGGTLITHLSRNIQANVDDIIFSGMFTAVQDFIKDTFVSDEDRKDEDGEDDNQWALDELKLGDNNILIERSKYTYLAVIFSGEGSKRLRRIVIKLLDKIETKYKNILPNWDGNINDLKGTKEILKVLIKVKEPEIPELPAPKPEPQTPRVSPTIAEPPQQSSLLAQLMSGGGSTPTVSTQPKLSAPIPTARPMYKTEKMVKGKDLTNVVREQTGAKHSGLTPWPLKQSQIKKRHGIDIKKSRLPMALNIRSKKRLPNTIVIERGQIKINGKPAKPITPGELNPKGTIKPVAVTLSGHDKAIKIDPSRSIMQQLADLEK